MLDVFCEKLNTIQNQFQSIQNQNQSIQNQNQFLKTELDTLKKKSVNSEFLIATTDFFKELTKKFIKENLSDNSYKRFTQKLSNEKLTIFSRLYPLKDYFREFNSDFFNETMFTTDLAKEPLHKLYIQFLSKYDINVKTFFYIQKSIMIRNQICHSTCNDDDDEYFYYDLKKKKEYFENSDLDNQSKKVLNKVIDALVEIKNDTRSDRQQSRSHRSGRQQIRSHRSGRQRSRSHN